jgi:hypothetical protein
MEEDVLRMLQNKAWRKILGCKKEGQVQILLPQCTSVKVSL